MKEIIETLEAERIRQDISYEKIAEKMESTRSVVYKALTQKAKPNFETLEGIAKVLGYKLLLIKEEREGVLLPMNGKTGEVVITKARQGGKSETLKNIAKKDLVKKAIPNLDKVKTNSLDAKYPCGCKTENLLFKRDKNCKLLKQQHKN